MIVVPTPSRCRMCMISTVIMMMMMMMIHHIEAYHIISTVRWNPPPQQQYQCDPLVVSSHLPRSYGKRQRSFHLIRHSILHHSRSSSLSLFSTTTTTSSSSSSILHEPDTEATTKTTTKNITPNHNNNITSSDIDTKSSINTTSSNIQTVRDELLDLLSSMRGEAYEMRRLEDCINTLESTYTPCQTVSFLNLLMNGSWQFLFSSHWINRTSVLKSFRLREMKQHIQTTDATIRTFTSSSIVATMGNVTNSCIWEWNQHPSDSFTSFFDCYGTFSIQGEYYINTNGRIVQCPTMDMMSSSSSSSSDISNMTLSNDDADESSEPPPQEQQEQEPTSPPEMILELLPKSSVPNNVTQLVQYIQRTMSQELFDIVNTGYDITYMDDTIRIIRYYSPTKYDGIRNIFRRC